jgi:hypothetical protein
LRLWREKEKRKSRKARQVDACFKQAFVFFRVAALAALRLSFE